jgi:hypothetical protein
VRDPQRLTAWASPADQATIKAIVQQIDVEGDPETSYSVQIYTLEGMSTRAIYYAGTFLASVVPQARFTPGSEEGQMVVWATAKDHEQIRGLIQQMTEAPPPEIARQVAVYSLRNITGASAAQVLSRCLAASHADDHAGRPAAADRLGHPGRPQDDPGHAGEDRRGRG